MQLSTCVWVLADGFIFYALFSCVWFSNFMMPMLTYTYNHPPRTFRNISSIKVAATIVFKILKYLMIKVDELRNPELCLDAEV